MTGKQQYSYVHLYNNMKDQYVFPPLYLQFFWLFKDHNNHQGGKRKKIIHLGKKSFHYRVPNPFTQLTKLQGASYRKRLDL